MPDVTAAYLPDAARWLACALPVAVLFACVACVRTSVPKAAGIGLVLATMTAFICGNVGEGQLAQGALSGASSAASILYAVWPAMILYDVLRQSGAFDVLRRLACSLSRDRLALVLLFGWAFSSFLQSITGFGVPVAVCAPFLAALGIRPVPAVVMTLLGHSWGNTFGTLAMAFDALLLMGGAGTQTPVDAASVAALASLLLWVVNACGGMLVALIYGGRRALAHGLPLIASLSCIMGGGQMLVSRFDAAIACFIPAAAGLLACIALFKAGAYAKPWDCPSRVVDAQTTALWPRSGDIGGAGTQAPAVLRKSASGTSGTGTQATSSPQAFREPYASQPPSAREAALAASPFVVLAALSLMLFAVPGVRDAARSVTVGGVALFGHAGFALVLSCLFAIGIMMKARRLSGAGCRAALESALGRLRGVSAGIVMLVLMASILQYTGQMAVLASGAAAAAGSLYTPLAPALGTFGAFVTSSNMSSNILLAGFQTEMAAALGESPELLLAAQTAGGAAGAAIGPSTILLGAATVNAAGREGEILMPLLAASFGQAALLGAITWGLAAIA